MTSVLSVCRSVWSPWETLRGLQAVICLAVMAPGNTASEAVSPLCRKNGLVLSGMSHLPPSRNTS